MLERFRTFADENYEKCLGCGHYPINNDRAVSWITAQPAGCAREFAHIFYAHLRHVSFDEWKTAMSKMAVEIITKITARKYSRVVIVVDGDIIKSNTMVAIMLFHHIGKYVTDVVGTVSGDYPRDTLFLHTDDCSYSGTQIFNTIKSYAGAVGGAAYVIACPFIGSAAYAKLKVLPWVKFPKIAVIFDSFQQQVENNTDVYACDDIMNKSMEIFNGDMLSTFQYLEDLSAIYFDHKLADNMSIFQKVLALGPVHDGAAIGSLISGCESFGYKAEGAVANAREFITDFDDDGVCPKAFYKTIGYTYNGAVVDKNRGIMSLMEL